MILASLKRFVRLRKTIRKNVAVGRRFSVGDRSVLWAPRSLRLGDDVALGSDVRVETDGEIGDHVLIANAAAIVGRSDHAIDEVGVSVREARWVGKDPTLSARTVVGSDVWIGYGAIVLSGVSIGDSSVVGAGAVVTTDIPANSIVVGVPARVVGQRIPPERFEEHWAALRRKGIRSLVPPEPN